MNKKKERLYALLSRKFFLTVGINIVIITIITILFVTNIGYKFDNGVIISRIPILSEDGFVKIIQALLLFDGTYVGVNMLQKWSQILGTKLNNQKTCKPQDKTKEKDDIDDDL